MEQQHSERIFGLDVVRAAAIWLVLLLHGRFLLYETPLRDYARIPLPDGVDLFFVLSGFLIGGILLRLLHTTPAPGREVLMDFWRRRWFRTLPAYYLILALNFALVRSNIIQEGIYNFNWRYFFFLQNFERPFVGFYRESWSLSVEEWFYVIVPVLLFALVRYIQPKRAYLLTVCMMLTLPVLCRYLKYDGTIDWFHVDQNIRKVVVTRLDSIGYGLLMAWLCRYYARSFYLIRWPALAIGLIGEVLLLHWPLAGEHIYSQVLYYTLAPLLMSLLLPMAASIRMGYGRVADFITYTSRISYSMYLINFSLVRQVLERWFPPQSPIEALIEYFLFWILVYAGATILYSRFEKPMMELRDR